MGKTPKVKTRKRPIDVVESIDESAAKRPRSETMTEDEIMNEESELKTDFLDLFLEPDLSGYTKPEPVVKLEKGTIVPADFIESLPLLNIKSEINKSLARQLYPVFLAKQNEHIFPTPLEYQHAAPGTILGISLFVSAHGNINGSFEDIPRTQAAHTLTHEENLSGTYPNTPLRKLKGVLATSTKNIKVNINYMDVSDMNIFLFNQGSCAGLITNASQDRLIKDQRNINRVMTNPLSGNPIEFDVLTGRRGYVEKTTSVDPKTFNDIKTKLEKQQKLTKAENEKLFSGKSGKMHLMHYKGEKVNRLAVKDVGSKKNEIMDTRGNTSILDSGKVLMMITKKEGNYCSTNKYVMLSTNEEMTENIRRLVSDFKSVNLEKVIEDYVTNVKSILEHGIFKTMYTKNVNLLSLIKGILHANGNPQAPVFIYDPSCNSFSNTHNWTTLTPDQLSSIRSTDDAVKGNDIAFGKKRSRKKSKRNKSKRKRI